MLISKCVIKQIRLKWISAAILTVFMGWMACSADDIVSLKDKMVSDAREAVSSVSIDDLAALIESGAEISLLDIRTAPEFDQGHIGGAKWAPRGKLEFLAAGGKLAETDAKIIVYCKKDSRAALGGKTLQDLGFSKVVYLKGGFKAWVEAGFSIYNMHGELTVKSFERSEGKE
jgi:rhodanese-related sulfurtransferase